MKLFLLFFQIVKSMANEKFCLRWNDFESNISVAFQEIRDDKDFFDVTLACDDDHIQVNKMILISCSELFHIVSINNRTLRLEKTFAMSTKLQRLDF